MLVLRPDPPAYFAELRRRGLALGGLAFISLVGVALRTRSVIGFVATVVAAGAVIVGCVVGIKRYLRGARVVLGADYVERTGPFLRRRRLSTDGLAGALTSVVLPMTAPVRILALAGNDARGRRRALRLTDSVWSPEQLDEIARHTGAVTVPGFHRAAAVERMVPGTMPFYYRHPWMFGWAVAIAITVVVIAAVLGFFIATDRPPFDDRPAAATSAAADPAVVAEHDAILDVVRGVLPGAWKTPDVRYIECEDRDGGKGWVRSVTTGRPDGIDLTDDLLDDLADRLVGVGFAADQIERSDQNELHVWPDGDPVPELAVIGQPNGDIWVNLTASCVAG